MGKKGEEQERAEEQTPSNINAVADYGFGGQRGARGFSAGKILKFYIAVGAF